MESPKHDGSWENRLGKGSNQGGYGGLGIRKSVVKWDSEECMSFRHNYLLDFPAVSMSPSKQSKPQNELLTAELVSRAWLWVQLGKGDQGFASFSLGSRSKVTRNDCLTKITHNVGCVNSKRKSALRSKQTLTRTVFPKEHFTYRRKGLRSEDRTKWEEGEGKWE